MADYNAIKGRLVQTLSSDPTLTSSYEGQVWYNSTEGVLKGLVLLEAWSSSSPLGTARYSLGAAGTQSAGLAFGGALPPSPGFATQNLTEEYNGSGWSTGGTLGSARYYIGGCGSQTAGLAFGGNIPGRRNETEEYNGTSWSEQNNLSTARRSMGSSGTQTAGLASGGDIDSGGVTPVNNTEEYDGTSWTTGGALNTARSGVMMGPAGTQTAAIIAGGYTGSVTAAVEHYDGSSWTNATSLPGTRANGGFAGLQTAGLVFGAISPARTTSALKYDGTTWTSAPSLATSVGGNVGTGTQSAALNFGGSTSSTVSTSNTEEFSQSINVTTAGAFSSGGNLNSARWGTGSAGTQTAGIVFGGRNPAISTDLALSEEYNGTSWSEGPDMGQARRVVGRGTGTQTAALAHGGHYSSPSTRYKVSEEYDGSSWTNGGTSTNFHDGTMQIGTQTAAASCGGYDGSPMNETEEYDGTSFSTANVMTYSAYMGAAAGPQTAAVVFAGGFPGVNNSNEYDGTNWTAGNTTLSPNYGIGGNGGTGSQTAALGAGGYTPGPIYFSKVETYDGTTFATAPSLATARSELPASGPNSSFFAAGGLISTGTASNSTEEFTGETVVATASTLTTS